MGHLARVALVRRTTLAPHEDPRPEGEGEGRGEGGKWKKEGRGKGVSGEEREGGGEAISACKPTS